MVRKDRFKVQEALLEDRVNPSTRESSVILTRRSPRIDRADQEAAARRHGTRTVSPLEGTALKYDANNDKF